jgi:hypothetical protein
MTIDSFTIYCLATGKPIADYNDDERGVVIDAIQHLPLADQADHLERLALSSMRPSLVWMSVTPALVEHMRQVNPTQLMAYLMNRLYASVDTDKRTGKPLSHEDSINARRLRIAMWESIESANLAPDQLDAILFVLLDLDSRFNLAKITKPANIANAWESWSEDSASQFIHDLWTWHHKLVVIQNEAERRAKYQAEFWSEGNRMTRTATLEQFKKVVPPHMPKKQQVAKTLKQQKAAKLSAGLDFLDELEKSLTVRAAPAPESVSTPKPAVTHPKVKITRFGTKKDS